jgi:hypothetical protein
MYPIIPRVMDTSEIMMRSVMGLIEFIEHVAEIGAKFGCLIGKFTWCEFMFGFFVVSKTQVIHRTFKV